MVEVIPLGGVGEIGKNMMVLRHQEQILIVDAGLAFPTDELYGVDLVVPDIQYLIEHKDEVKGIVLTHGHEDHVGALPYVLPEINVPVYGTEMTLALIRHKLTEKGLIENTELIPMIPGEAFHVGVFEVLPVRVTHSIPETCSIAIKTSLGTIVMTGDFKFDLTPIGGKLSDMALLGRLGDNGVLLLMSDTTNVDCPGWGPSERLVGEELGRIIDKAPGRVLVTTFASNIHRLQQVMDCAKNAGRKVAVVGRRIEQTCEIARDLGYLKYPSDLRIRVQDIDQYAPNEVLIMTTGSQGEPLSALSLMAQDEYPRMKITPGDTVILSASPIPGNESLIRKTINRLVRQGANVIYTEIAPVHASGHAHQEELKLMLCLLRPYYLAPVHGEPRHQHLYREMALNMGWTNDQIVQLDLGDRLILTSEGIEKGDKVPSGRVLIDSGGGSGIPEEIVRDRRHLASDGIVMVLVGLSAETGEVLTEPEFVIKGLAVTDDSLWEEAKKLIMDKLAELSPAETADSNAVEEELADVLKKFLRKKAQRRPVIVPVVVEM